MAGRRIGEAFIRVRPDTTGFAREAQPGAVAAGRLAGQIFAGSFAGTFSGRLLGGLLQQAFRTVQSFARDTFGEAREAAKIGRLTDAVIKSTGRAARVSAKDIAGLSERLGELAGVDDDTVQAGTNLLLTFTKVRNETGKGNQIFDLATQAALDMSAAMHNGNVTTEGFRGTILQVGKALNDPVTGMNALRRAGVTFTDQQKKTIKSLVAQGKTAEAQKIILAELRKEFGGAAAAATDDAQKAQVAWANFKEEIGGVLLPVVGRLAKAFTSTVLPAVRMFFNTLKTGKTEDEGTKIEQFALALRSVWQVLTTRVIPALQRVGGIVGKALGWLTGSSTWAGVFRSALLGAVAAIVAITTVVKIWTAVQTVLNIVLTANPIGIIIVAIAALVAGIIYAYKHSETFRKIVQAAWNGIKTAALATARFFVDYVWPAIKYVYDAIVFGIKVVIAGFKFYWNLAVAIVTAVWRYIAVRVEAGITLVRLIVARIRLIIAVFREAFDRARAAVVDRIGAVVAFMRGLPGRLIAALGNLGRALYNAGADLIRGLWEGIKSLGDWLAGKVRGFIEKYVPGPVRKLLGIGSPSRLFAGFGRDTVRGFTQGWLKAIPDLDRAIRGTLPKTAVASGTAGGITVQNLNLRAYSDRFSLRQVQDELALRGVH